MTERTTTGPLLSRRFHLVLLHLAEEARRDLDSIAVRPDRAIHSLRTRMKNLRALLVLVKPRMPKPERKSVAKLAGALKDAFSEQRDAHVVAALRTKFPGIQGSTAKQNAATENAERARKAKADASRLIRMVSKLTLSGLTWADVMAGYLWSYRAGRKALKACERERTPKSFHELRRPVKDLFYQSQVLQPLDGMKHRRSAADRLGDRLGEMNDLHLLHARAKKSRSSDALKHIAKKQRALKPAIFKAAAKLFAERPGGIERTLERCVKFQPAITAQAVRQT
ncbi:MAG: CHAD domain-containing protein [Chthoniobacteraceae bacterium]